MADKAKFRFIIIASVPFLAITAWSWVYYDSLMPMLMLPIGAILGPFVGVFSDEPYFTYSFKLTLLVGLMISGSVFCVGIRKRSTWWGQLLAVIGFLAWSVCGLIGFGPQ